MSHRKAGLQFVVLEVIQQALINLAVWPDILEKVRRILATLQSAQGRPGEFTRHRSGKSANRAFVDVFEEAIEKVISAGALE